ncbi:hypothetical protein C0J52_08151 [Blattella germanica]|nr:hypothetical protein C0J52_08151 [Blattella germanica]
MIQEHSSVPTSTASGLQTALLTGQNLHSSTVSHHGSGPLVSPALRSSPGLLQHASVNPGGMLSRSSHSTISSTASNIKCLSSDGNIAQSSMISQPIFGHGSLVSDSTGRQLHSSTTVNIDPVPRTHASNKRLRKSSPTVDSVHVKKRSCHNGQMARSLDFQKSYTPSQPDIQCEESRDSISGFSQSSGSCELIPLPSKVPITDSVFNAVAAAITTTASSTSTTATISNSTPTVTTVATTICSSVTSTSIAPVVLCIPTTNSSTIGSSSMTAAPSTIITSSSLMNSANDTNIAPNPGTSADVPTGMFSAPSTEVSNLTDATVNTPSNASPTTVLGTLPVESHGRSLRRRKRDTLNNSSDSTGGMSSGSAGDILKEKLASKVRRTTVKTTQELVAFVQNKRSEEKLAAISQTSLKESSVVKWGVPTDALDVTRYKKEHLEKYLQAQSELYNMEEDPSDTPEENLDDLRLQRHLRISHTDNGASVAATNVQGETVEELLARLPPVDFDAICWDDLADDVELKASINKEVTEELITKLQVEHVDGMNGNINDGAKPGEGGDFREWHETLSKKSYQGEFLHILPYVVID